MIDNNVEHHQSTSAYTYTMTPNAEAMVKLQRRNMETIFRSARLVAPANLKPLKG